MLFSLHVIIGVECQKHMIPLQRRILGATDHLREEGVGDVGQDHSENSGLSEL